MVDATRAPEPAAKPIAIAGSQEVRGALRLRRAPARYRVDKRQARTAAFEMARVERLPYLERAKWAFFSLSLSVSLCLSLLAVFSFHSAVKIACSGAV